jgi:hypothetical protein
MGKCDPQQSFRAYRSDESINGKRSAGGAAECAAQCDVQPPDGQPAADLLRELGHTVLEARDGPEALRILGTTRPDLLVTDVHCRMA